MPPGPSTDAVIPILFRSATPRITGPDIGGFYAPHLQVWAIEERGELRPIIEAVDESAIATETTTKVRQEADDEDMDRDLRGCRASAGNLVELVTKTEVQQESDDHMEPAFKLALGNGAAAPKSKNTDGAMLLELETKTSAEVEHDDVGPIL